MNKKYITSIAVIGLSLFLPVLLAVMVTKGKSGNPLEKRVISEYSFLSESVQDIQLIFFGYAGCTSKCPESLHKISMVLDSLNNRPGDNKAGALFVDIKAEAARVSARAYGEQFSKYIRGVNVTNEELKNLKADFSLRTLNFLNKEQKMLHTDYFFVVKKNDKNWVIHRVLGNNTDTRVLAETLTELSPAAQQAGSSF